MKHLIALFFIAVTSYSGIIFVQTIEQNKPFWVQFGALFLLPCQVYLWLNPIKQSKKE